MAALACAAALSPASAMANGRAPSTNGVHFRPGDRHSLYVAATFGLLISHDDGCSFRWVCEQDIGYGGTFDPKYRIAADGAIFATTFNGLQVSRDGGCSFTTATAELPADAPGRIAGRWIDAIDIGPTGDVWVATADSGRPNNLYRSTDNGATFAPLGMVSPSIWWKSIAVAPSRAQRVYATGYQVAGVLADAGQMPPTAHFEITDDAAGHWTESALAGVRFGTTPLVHVLAVDPADPDRVFMASAGANPPTGDRLYRSTDGGASFTEVLAPAGSILDLAIASDGRVLVATLGTGAFESVDRGATFAPIAGAPQLACIGQRSDGQLFGCAANWEPDNAAIASSLDARTWDKRFRFSELAGALDCPAGTAAHDRCASLWPAVQQQLGATAPPAVCGAPPDPPPGDGAQARRSAGCCAAAGASPGELGGLIGLGALCVAQLRRRRRRAALGYRAASSAASPSRQLG